MDFGVKRPLFGKEIPMRTVNEVSKLIITPVQKKFYQVWERCMQVAENLPKTLIAMVEKELLCLQQKQLRYIANKRAQLSVF